MGKDRNEFVINATTVVFAVGIIFGILVVARWLAIT